MKSKYRKQFYQKHKESLKRKFKLFKKNYRWKVIYQYIKTRCNNPKSSNYKNYGGRGIKCLITAEEIKILWFRDKAYLMKKPSIDRKDNNGNYEINNCRFIEFRENSSKSNLDHPKGKTILQYDLAGNFIKEWKGIKEAGRQLKIWDTTIGNALRSKSHKGKGFIWQYK